MAKILIIDDDSQTLKILRKILENKGYGVIEAANGKIGLRLYQKEKTDLIITDIIMPEMDGIEMIMELKEDFPDVNIIAISGGGRFNNKYLKIAGFLGAKYVFEKPFDNAELLKAIEEIIG